VRILSYNIHKGFTVGNLGFVLDGIKRSIREVHADLVFLQEVMGEGGGGGGKQAHPQFEYLADQVWPHFAYGKNAVYSSGNHGNAILSKFPIRAWENIDISPSRIERRGILHATLELPDGSSFHALCTHLALMEKDRAQQIGHLAERVRGSIPPGDRMVLAGDFNDWRENSSASLRERAGLREAFETLHGSHARTFPSWWPRLRLDRIYYRGLEPVSAEVLTGSPWNRLSDHAALYCEFR
jgi:endonuclease/exonuclease/phosphatase family metal-dependent hydrolase